MLRLTAVVLLCALALPAWAAEGEKEVTYKVGVDEESLEAFSRLLGSGPLGKAFYGLVRLKVIQPILFLSLALGCGIPAFLRLRGKPWKYWFEHPGELAFPTICLMMGGIVGLTGFLATCPYLIAPHWYAIRDIISSLR